ncbi:ABC transporter ATP-binding protein [Haloquadratum walsbyi]|uniref:Oligopeptide/dipeptide ABC transporter, ATP-binding protein, C-terminal domain protein n=1 Tax=Haloquadratum walsbyi J07HQW2 TaxID=1238425 RepID=U1PUU7_9EURY|nr:ABC transporter ATP-binding protein [Haloquadratum walsbyi]ERG96161.1 MAG: oligopeptide/dipeptide ABC transporter, ATP-binding protein, C-terminal domain protein [Haloquadratum walsbyi J07HQW2]
MTGSDPLLEMRDLAVTFPVDDGPDIQAVESVDLTLRQGEVHGLVGESGSGKSVTARAILRLLDDARVNADELTFDSTDLLAQSEKDMRSTRGAEIGMIFQDSLSALNPVMTVGEQIAEVVRHHTDVGESTGTLSELRRKYITGTDETSESWKRAVELLEIVGIPDASTRASEYPHQLSGGQRQRVMIAQALAGDPSVIIADEPTTALDVTVEADILAELRSLCDDFDVSVLLITHDLGVVAETCDRVTVMYSGSVMEQGLTDSIFTSPSHPYTEGLLQSIPEYSAQSNDGELRTTPGSAPDPRNRPDGCPFRDRCPIAFDACSKPLPTHSVTDDHIIRCHDFTNDRPGDASGKPQQAQEIEVSE